MSRVDVVVAPRLDGTVRPNLIPVEPWVADPALDDAINGLRRRAPLYSAAEPLARWQIAMPPLLLALGVGVVTAPADIRTMAMVALALPFLIITLQRGLALFHISRAPTLAAVGPLVVRDCDLPHYSVLVPLYREVEVAGGLIAALGELDYPTDKLDIIFLTEVDDEATRVALARGDLAPHMKILTVPAGWPKTKPRALNYGLQFAGGSLIAIFDAEDVPDRGQLRAAAARFAVADGNLACVQARLAIYNPAESWLTRQFALEYAALFRAILLSLQRLGWPLPLGGTSNHFRRSHLVAVGAWDPYNVTEDADLGFRFARVGYDVEMLDSTTWEEAPAAVKAWRGQRTRWLKGWFQTYLVHMRDPALLWRELGPWRFVGLQVTLGGTLLAALLHPWMYVIGIALLCGVGAPHGIGHGAMHWLFVVNLVAAYVTGVLLAIASVTKSGLRLIAPAVIGLPIYWLAISAAAYRALLHLVIRPYDWEKTPHGSHFETNGSARP